MSDIILHHYELSPYSEKVRAILGFKKLAWRSVLAPMILPKPDLIPLTGGYRKTPVLQIGRDVYCDSRLIVHVLERLRPAPAILPAALEASCAAFALLEPTLFAAAMGTAFQPAGAQILVQHIGLEAFEQFIKDRAELFKGGSARRPSHDFAEAHFLPLVGAVDRQLAGHPFLLGKEPTLADFVTYHPIWFIARNPGVAGCLRPFAHVAAWMERMAGLGHGTPSELSSADALAIARESSETGERGENQGSPPFLGTPVQLERAQIGQRVTVSATDYGVDAVEGTLVHASTLEVAIQRHDERAGTVIVHFPRIDSRVAAVA
ncbi:glutathione S-transferase family protein [Pendulispora albinea]|uniref:Glutathione S-transferase family protein n=1 Tax=Pendulispora albinea TaxID=2741071 RepID=A0ABZ2M360_9BACT